MSLVSEFDLNYARRLLDSAPVLAEPERALLKAFIEAGTCPNEVHAGIREQTAQLLVAHHQR